MKKLADLVLTLTMAISLTACGGGGGGGGTSSGSNSSGGNSSIQGSVNKKTDLVIAVSAEAVTLDPQDGWDGNSLIVMRQMYNGLVKYNNNMEFVGDLAESWDFTSDTSVTFKLKQGVKFHNGEEMTAEDVVYSIERAMESAKVKTFTANISSVTADDTYTVTVNTSIPYAPLMSNLCHSANYIVSKQAAEAAGDSFSMSPVGTGAFKFVQWDSGDKIVLARHDDYFDSEVLPSTLTFRYMSEGAARTIALETGEVDVVNTVAAADASRVESESSLKLVASVTPKIEYLSMNQKTTPFANKLVRQAINYAIDRESLNLVATSGYSQVTDSVMSSAISGYSEDVTHYEYNPEKARELLTQAGYPNGFSTYIVVGTEARNTEAVLIQSNLHDIGIEMEIKQMDSTAALEAINNGENDMFLQSYNNTTGDPDTSLYMLFHSSVPASSGNRSFTSIPEVDALLDQGRSEIDTAKRMEIYKQVQQLLTEAAVWVPLHSIVNTAGIRADLQGYTTHPLGYVMYDQLHY